MNTTDYIKEKIKEFREIIYSYNRSPHTHSFYGIERKMQDKIESFLTQALEEQREEIIKEVKENIRDIAHVYSEREILLMEDEKKIQAHVHNANMKRLFDSLKKGKHE